MRSRHRSQAAIGITWRNFYETTDGRAAIAELAVWCNVYTPIESNDPIEMARMNGERNAYLHIVTLMGLKPESFMQNAERDTDILDRMINSDRRQ